MAGLLLPAAVFAAAGEGAPRPASIPDQAFESRVKPLLQEYCLGCHGAKKKGDLDLRNYSPQSARRDTQLSELILDKIARREMPPEEKPQPTAGERQLLATWIEIGALDCDCSRPDPGRVTIHRLNRTEYNNTIRDLTGVDFHPADDFPADDVGNGFDNMGDVLSLSPMLLEKYLAAAVKIMDAVTGSEAATNRQAAYGGIYFRLPTPRTTNETASLIVERFARRAFRRPVEADELRRLLALFHAGQSDGRSFEGAVKQSLEAVLVSPNFLFRGDLQSEPGTARPVRPIDDYSLASRLSYFLWSTMPDQELSALADQGGLRPNLEAQVRRMLRDSRSQALVENFASQWLQLRKLAAVTPDKKTFPEFDEELRDAMTGETEHLFSRILREDRSILEFLDADYSYVNGRLAKHYGLKGITGKEFQLVKLTDDRRGGLLTQAGILTLTSTSTRTSPVKRGKWVLDNILGEPPPPPPANVPPLPEDHKAAQAATLRQRMETHRSDPACASCHARMDPIGFSFENYDAVGAWRTNDGAFPIDAAGEFFSGEKFTGAAELRTILAQSRKDEFARCVTEKMLAYALGRGLERRDKCAVDTITKRLAADHYRFSTLVLEITRSLPFEYRRGESADAGLAQNR